MIHVIASIFIRDGKMPEALAVYQRFVPNVLEEKGCRMYCPTIDFKTDIPTQEKDPHIITVIEKWEDLASFHAHLSAPHVIQFREEMKNIMEKVSIKVLSEML